MAVITPWAPVLISLELPILPGTDESSTLGTKTMRDRLRLDMMESLDDEMPKKLRGDKGAFSLDQVAKAWRRL